MAIFVLISKQMNVAGLPNRKEPDSQPPASTTIPLHRKYHVSFTTTFPYPSHDPFYAS